jgi:hypothetical protein
MRNDISIWLNSIKDCPLYTTSLKSQNLSSKTKLLISSLKIFKFIQNWKVSDTNERHSTVVCNTNLQRQREK